MSGRQYQQAIFLRKKSSSLPILLIRLRVPDVPLVIRQRWEKLLCRHQQRQRELDEKWHLLMRQAQDLFEDVHGETKRQRLQEAGMISC